MLLTTPPLTKLTPVLYKLLLFAVPMLIELLVTVVALSGAYTALL